MNGCRGAVDLDRGFVYRNRAERSRFTAEVFRGVIGRSVLDVGCWQRDLNTYIEGNVEYVGVDVAGDPDHVLDLEEDELAPFDDGEFDTVVCTDVLEHLGNIHSVFDELCRVSADTVIVSLPNNYMLTDIVRAIRTGNTVRRKFYGLPATPPEDRHKWFFNYRQAEDFVEHRSAKNGFAIVEHVDFPDDIHPALSKRLLRKSIKSISRILQSDARAYENLFVPSHWFVLESKD